MLAMIREGTSCSAIQDEMEQDHGHCREGRGRAVIREYKTIRDLRPLMVVGPGAGRHLTKAGRDPAGRRDQIHTARVKVNGDSLWSREASASTWLDPESRFWATPAACPAICWAELFNGMGKYIGGGPAILATVSGHQRLAMNAARNYPNGGGLSRRAFLPSSGLEHPGRGPEAAHLRLLSLPQRGLARLDRPPGQVLDAEELLFRGGLCRHRHHLRGVRVLRQRVRHPGAIDCTVLFSNLANDPAVERILLCMALTAAEYLAFEKGDACTGHHDRHHQPRRGPCGRSPPPSITLIPHPTDHAEATRPTHPILTRVYHRGQIILSRELFRRGINPPVDVLRLSA